ncbi:hypothetical protein M3201_17825 [Paenibacillus motobuensis]|uniref:hypothetical protein n=1 Tax=Paenibacillus TaxID=44249 RepID=UPI002040A112|nr:MULTISPECIES: hypothetical protein [Paenibacillus]MCM3041556.1 hypothetical protein [Paenibacillus lutimineralis]MCM3648660.1 hypothetical protein [Paenibacillus motobuensis]
MNILLIVVAILLFAGQTLSMKLIRAQHLRDRLLINTGFTLIASTGLLLFSLAQPDIRQVSANTWVLGILFGLCFTLTIIFYNLAISAGPLSYTAFYFSASMIIPALTGIAAFGEALKLTVAVAMLLFLAAFYFINMNPDNSEPRGHIDTARDRSRSRWKLYCLLTFLCNGMLAVIQRLHQFRMEGTESKGLMLVGFLFACLFYALAYTVLAVTGNKKERISLSQESALMYQNIVPILLLAATSLIGNLIITYLAGVVPSSYLFPLVQGSIIVSITLCSVLIFREKLSRLGRIGISLGVLAIVVINL